MAEPAPNLEIKNTINRQAYEFFATHATLVERFRTPIGAIASRLGLVYRTGGEWAETPSPVHLTPFLLTCTSSINPRTGGAWPGHYAYSYELEQDPRAELAADGKTFCDIDVMDWFGFMHRAQNPHTPDPESFTTEQKGLTIRHTEDGEEFFHSIWREWSDDDGLTTYANILEKSQPYDPRVRGIVRQSGQDDQLVDLPAPIDRRMPWLE